MAERIETDICVIGAGSGGLSVAAGASQMGAKTVLIEKGRMGGDCLNFGCVPSKALLAAAHAAQSIRDAARFGVEADEPRVDFRRVHDHVHGVIAAIAPHDSVDRFEGLGVHVIQEEARFENASTMRAGDTIVTARRFVVATGSTPAVPPIPGLAEAGYLTNETVFDLTELPAHLVVIGGGPIGMELAQAFRRLGAAVTVIEAFSVLGKDDPELAEVVRLRLMEEGVTILEGTKVDGVARDGAGISVSVSAGDSRSEVKGSHLLVAVGRRPNVAGLGLEEAGIAFTDKGITVDSRLRTSNKRVFAMGDVTGPYQFTHMASYHAGIIIRNALFRLPAKVDYRAVPWVTYTSPELAQVGLSEAQARDAHGDIRILRFPMAEMDRAQAERDIDGSVKVVTTKKGIVVGAACVGAQAGEIIQSWILPVARGLHIKHMAGAIAPYPTRGEINKRAAGTYYVPSLFSPRTRKIVRLLAKLG